MLQPLASHAGLPDLLIVDDDVLVVQHLQTMLRGVATLRMARTGREAVRQCEQTPPDLILLDLNMSGMDGIETFRLLQSDPRLATLPVVFITAEQDVLRHAQALDLGAEDWLTKPLSEERVRSRVQAVLRRIRRAAAFALPPPGARPVVLVVDDDANAIDALHAALVPLGVECVAAASGAEALALARRHPPDLVLLDVQMPGMDGFEVAEALFASPLLAQVPVVFITRFANVAAEARALELGAHDFIAKPYSEPVLQARVRNVLLHRHRAQQALREAREHWRRIGDHRIADIVAKASDAVLTVDGAGTVVLANAAASRLFELPAAQLVGKAIPEWLQVALPDGDAEVLDPLAPPPRITVQPPDRAPLTLRAACSASGKGSERLRTYILHDLTLQERADAEARERVRAQAESRTKTLMMSYLAHEIGNPLNAVLGLAQLLALDGPTGLSPLQMERVQLLLDNGRLLTRLLRDAMDLARGEAGRFELQLRELDLTALVNAALAAVSAQASAAHVELQLEAQPGSAPTTARADAARLQQCLLNLLTNAIKYGGSGGRVTVSLRADGAGVAIDVADQGPGMTPEQIQHLFEPFNRLGQSGTPGQGLGLAVTRMLVMAMGGTLAARSASGQGTCFTLGLPAAAPPPPPPSSPPQPPLPPLPEATP